MYSAVEHLARTLWLSGFEWSNRLAMYSAYFDESGHPDDSDYLVVGGAVADLRQWAHLEREWLDALSRSDKKTCDFHFTECRDEELKLQLARIISRRVEKTIAIAVPLHQYYTMNESYVLAEVLGFPYPLAARSCIGAVERWVNHHSIEGRVEYVFEDGAKHRGQLNWIAERDHLPLPIYKKKMDLKPLQVGDLIAGEIRRLMDVFLRTGFSQGTAVTEELEKASHHWGILDFHFPEKIAAVYKIPIRDPNCRYRCKIRITNGVRTAVVHSWTKGEGHSMKKALHLPGDPQPVTHEVALARLRKYESEKIGT